MSPERAIIRGQAVGMEYALPELVFHLYNPPHNSAPSVRDHRTTMTRARMPGH
ncbi:MAG: hypothetical protein VX715_13045 [Planctomycetota bacterium]|nr:hypothetical protein [Planctomycetota bacterium]